MGSFPPWNCRNGLWRAWPHLNMDSGSERPCFSKYSVDRSHLFLLCPVWGSVGLNGPGTHESARLELSTTQRQGRVGNVVLFAKQGETIWKMASVCCNLFCFFLEKKLSSTERVFIPGPLSFIWKETAYITCFFGVMRKPSPSSSFPEESSSFQVFRLGKGRENSLRAETIRNLNSWRFQQGMGHKVNMCWVMVGRLNDFRWT